jgi:hypothetical protein
VGLCDRICWLVELLTFFSDICAWATEPDSAFAHFAPRTIPVNRHTLLGHGFEKARARTRARITATVLALEREMPKIRAFALQRWKAALAAPKIGTTRGYPWSHEVNTFWDGRCSNCSFRVDCVSKKLAN